MIPRGLCQCGCGKLTRIAACGPDYGQPRRYLKGHHPRKQRALSDPVLRFWAKVDRTGGCWLWVGNKLKSGYGLFRPGGAEHHKVAHRVSWDWANGPIPDGMSVLHKCDVRACVNPDHLFLGTQIENMRDMVAKGRAQHGESRPNAKLTEALVRQARTLAAQGESFVEIARRFGVSDKAIRCAVIGATWRHVA